MRQTRPTPQIIRGGPRVISRAYMHAWRRLRSVWAAQVVQRNWRGYASRRWFQLLRRQQAACGHMQRVARGALCRWRVKEMKRKRDHAAALIQVIGGWWAVPAPHLYLVGSPGCERPFYMLALCWRQGGAYVSGGSGGGDGPWVLVVYFVSFARKANRCHWPRTTLRARQAIP